MKNSITNPGLETIIRIQLRQANLDWLDDSFAPVVDCKVHGTEIAVYCAALSQNETNAMFDAWIVAGGPITGFYNRDCYPTYKDAVMQHVGRLVVDCDYKLVSKSDARKRSKRNSA